MSNAAAKILPQAKGNDEKGCLTGGLSLVYSDTQNLMIMRRRWGKSWAYFDKGGRRITDEHEIARLNAIALPPAYTDAAFNADPNGHLQAYGTDARGRRQYRYHPAYRASQESEKFGLCHEFGQELPKLRRRITEQLQASPTSRDAVMAAMITILDQEYLRVGNEQYCRHNKSFGLTTLRNRHAKSRGNAVQLQYRGKAGIQRSVKLNDRSLIRVVRRCQDLPGQNLFQYRDDSGEVHAVSSNDINAFLRDTMGDNFTAKNFRTWHASVIAYAALRRGTHLKDVLSEVSSALGNTPAIARKSYIHPSLFEIPSEDLISRQQPRSTKWLSGEERGLIEFLQSLKVSST